MFTVCPKCALTLAITTRDLRAAQGHVRCGRCHNVFNALDSLSDEHPHAPPAQPVAAPVKLPHDDLAPPPAPLVCATTGQHAAAGELSADFQPNPPETAEPPGAPSDLEPLPFEDAPESEPRLAADPQDGLPDLEPPQLSDDRDPAEVAPEADFALEPDRPRASAGWTVGAALLTVLLMLQIANHDRGILATFPAIGAPLRAAYGALGIDINPQWDVRAYDARQLGATVSGTNPREITVHASIANRAPRAQPLPLLRVTLQDRFGHPIAARDVAPRNYLHSIPSPPLLPPGGRVDASVVFISPGSGAVGFEIDACLPEDGTVICAHGT